MSMKSKRLWSILSLVIVLTMVVSPVLAFPQTGTQKQDDPLPRNPIERPVVAPVDRIGPEQVEEIPMEVALERIDPILRDAAQAGGKDLVDVYISVQGNVAVSQYLSQAIVRPAVFAGISNIYGKATASSLLKIAQQPGVLAVVSVGQELELPYTPEQTVLPNADRLNSLRVNELTFAEAQAASNDVSAQGWFDVLDGHKSAAAWEKGFTGEGVIVGIMDDGVDFAHPDLQGTYAWVTDSDSPYYGWPMAFSPLSVRYFAQEVFLQDLGAYGITEGWTGSRWTDSQYTVETSSSFEGDIVTGLFSPIGTSQFYEYTLTGTSASGFYKFGSHPDRDLASLYGHRAAVLVVDEHVPGVYDTVYVDLDNDKDFTDEKPVTKDSPEVYRDMDGDGYADVSGGLLVWVSDGDNTPPTADWLWGIECGDEVGTLKACPDAGELVLFAGAFDSGYSHGTNCASNVAAQGVASEGLSAPSFLQGGVVQGGAPDVGIMDFGNFYYSGSDEDGFLVASLGYDGIPDTGDEVQITSNSYGAFRQMWGGWGYMGRLITALNMTIAPNTVWLFSAGNEGPGYGPQEGDGGPTTIQVGSSTQYGSTNWDSIASADQIVSGDVTTFFSKGPNRDGSSGLDVLANGGRGSGSEKLNYYGFNGAESWSTWGGTSRSAPVAAGNLALVYQAYHDRYGEWPTWEQAKALFKSGADNASSSPFFQGGGVVNSDRATDLAAGIYGVYAMPDEWQVGDWEGVDYLNFANVAEAGETYTQTYEVYNPSGYDIEVALSEGIMTRVGSEEMTFTTEDISEESVFNFYSPDYLVELDPEMIPDGTELMVVRYVHSFDTFVPDYDPVLNPHNGNPDSSWRFMVYNWTDQNGDGMLWDDADENGVVGHMGNGLYDNDGFERLDFENSEIQEGEYIRMDYSFGGLSLPIMIRDPQERMADGYFVGFQHRLVSPDVPTTTLTIGVEFYKRADWAWLELSEDTLEVPAEDMATFDAVMSLPADVAPGAYEGVIFVNDPGTNMHDPHETALPVVVNVMANLEAGSSLTFGGDDMADTLYQNSWTNGYFNFYGGGWTGAGDWRHYFFNVDETAMGDGNFLIRTSWDGGFPTDINTWLLGPTYDCASNGVGCSGYEYNLGLPQPDFYGPYTLWPIAGTDDFQAGASYEFNTSTGGPEDWLVAGIEMPGLHEIALHNVLYSGEALAEQFEVELGTIGIDYVMDPDLGSFVNWVGPAPSELGLVFTNTGSFDVEFTPTIALPDIEATLSGGLETTSYGPFTSNVPDAGGTYDPWDSNNVYEPIMVDAEGATKLEVYLYTPAGQDPDMFLIYDENDNGVPDEDDDRVVGSSGSATGSDEQIIITNPDLGRYFVVLHGYTIDPTSGVDMDWEYYVTAPGDLPMEPVEVFSGTVSIDQNDKFDPTTASYSTTVTTDDRAAALHIQLTGIPAGNDVDLYVTDDMGDLVAYSQTSGNAGEHIEILPAEGEYRLGSGMEYTIWVHGYDVPGGAIDPVLKVWWDSLNVWLTENDPNVSVQAIDPGQTAKFTVNFEALDWNPFDPPLSVRLIAGSSVAPGFVDRLVSILYVVEPSDPGPSPYAYVEKSFESERGPSLYSHNGWPTALVNTGDLITFTLHIENVGDETGIFYGEDWILSSWADVTNVYTETAGLDSYGYSIGSPWDIITFTKQLDPGESVDLSYVVEANKVFGGNGWVVPNYFDVYDTDDTGLYYDGDINYMHFRGLTLDGSYKMASQGVVAPGETFTYTFSFANPSSYDEYFQFVDPLPEEVEIVSYSNALTYDADSHTLSWDGMLPGTTLSTIDTEAVVKMKEDAPEGISVENVATLSTKLLEGGYTYNIGDSVWVDDGMDPDLTVHKSVDSLSAYVGDTLEYTIMIKNEGDEAVMDAMVYDMVPYELDVDPDSITGDAVYEDGMIMWMGDLDAGEMATITFEATINDMATDNLALINAAVGMAENQYGDVYNSAVTEVQGMNYIYLPIVLK